jgi:hypothetical protein
MGETNSGVDASARHGRSVTFRGAVGSVAAGVCRNLSLKTAANSASSKMVSYPVFVNGTSG